MRWSRFFLFTAREAPRDAEVPSHRLMLQAGLIKRLAPGIYSRLPLFLRSTEKLQSIVRRELETVGAVELSMPVIQPAGLWRESHRFDEYGPEMLRFEDRQGQPLCFGPTAEEVVTDIVRHHVRSYKRLPLTLFQIQTKFRDEIRPRLGVLRGREFLMKDAYSFHTSEESLDQTYLALRQAYSRIFEACDLDHTLVEADTGSIGGSSSDEFIVTTPTGESTVARCNECGYAADTETARTGPLEAPTTAESPLRQVETPGTTSIQQITDFLQVSAEQVVKTLIYTSETEQLVAVAVRGDREVNTIRLARHLGVVHLRLATEEEVAEATGAPVGFAGPVGLAEGVRLLADESVRDLESFVCGANEADAHLVGVRWQRDTTPDEWVDVRLAEEEDPCPKCGHPLRFFRGIEVGHIFKLGSKYSAAMGCTYQDEEGAQRPMIMGCYGLGIDRTLAAAIEQHYDADGILWPLPLAPFQVLLIGLNTKDEEVVAATDELYEQMLEQGLDVFYDDRKERPGVKFNDADLLGFPLRVVVGKKSLAQGTVEFSTRSDRQRQPVDRAIVIERLVEALET